jgi:hypothetical protein
MSEGFAIFIVIISAFLMVGLLVFVLGRLKNAGDKWSIADALSEEVEVGTTEKDPNTKLPIKNNEGNIAMTSEMKASSSRLIALLGLIAILALYVGAGLSVIYEFALNHTVPSGTKDIAQFFLYGLVMFAPYAVNKVTSMFDAFK